MIDPKPNNLTSEQFRQIEDIIDARKLLGQYNIYKQSNNINCRYVYSNSTGTSDRDRVVKYDETVVSNDGINLSNVNIKQTESEITVVRIKCRKITLRNRQSKWDMHDVAIPGDGCHLGESPSLVNLVTLVGYNVPCEGEEYLVPLSSWEPYLKHEDVHSDLKSYSEFNFDTSSDSNKKTASKTENHILVEDTLHKTEASLKSDGIDLVFRRPGWAGRLSNFIRKHCKKSKTLPDSCRNNS